MKIGWMKACAGAAFGLALSAMGAQASILDLTVGNLTYNISACSPNCDGIELHASGAGVRITGLSGGQLLGSGLDLSFRLTVTSTGFDLTSWASQLIGGTGAASVGETVTGDLGGTYGDIIVTVGSPNGTLAGFAAAEQVLYIEKDLNTQSTVAASTIGSLYQGPTLVPEPMSAALLGLGLAGFAALRRRRTAA